MRRVLALALGMLLPASTPAQEGPPVFRNPHQVVAVLLDLASDQGLRLDALRVEAAPEPGQLLVRFEASDLPLWKLTPFLFMASGQTEITRREPTGRVVEYPVLAPEFRPQQGPVSVGVLARVLDGPFLARRRVARAAAKDGTGSYRVGVELPPDMVLKLCERLSKALGPGRVQFLELEMPTPDRAALRLGGPTPAPSPGEGGAAQRFPSWGAAVREVARKAVAARQSQVGANGLVERASGEVELIP